jgi:hypothetical protein
VHRFHIYHNVLSLFTFIVIFLGCSQHIDAREISGSADGLVNCSTNSKDISASLSIAAFKNSSPLYGSWEVIINNESGDNFSNSGYLNDGNVQNNSYRLNGVETNNDICGAKTPSNVVIGGSCGSDGSIQVQTENWIGTFDGNIMCNIESNSES